MEKNCILNQSINQSPSLFDAPGTEACTSEFLSALTASHRQGVESTHKHYVN